ncbi:MAG TPA: SDR family oxidoreductase [Bryobacteraceae bacterium]|jgi:UDP-glucose 4-epimerase|nr:SDR family oxidoreductase [Bryobacteraceae bacterium]
MSRFLITGGAGFIGSALTRGLLAKGADRVVIVDNLLTGHERNLTEVAGQIDFHRSDICDYDALLAAMEGVDVVFHEAAIPSVPRSIHEPVPSHEVNVNGTFNVLRAAKESGVRRVIYAASSSAYGDSLTLPKIETMQANPKSPYAAQKLLGEYYMSVWASCFGLETISLRYFNVFGPRQDPASPYSGVLSLFMTAILERRAPTIFGDGEQSRDFTFVEDVVALNIKAAEAPANVCGRMYNAGNGGRVTLNQAWAMLQKIEGVAIEPNYGPSRAGDVHDSQADTTDARQFLGHEPQFTFEQGMRTTLDWYRQHAFSPQTVSIS